MADDARREQSPTDLRNVRGAVYLPEKDWNAYQHWANYENDVTERDLGYAAKIGLNSLRVLASYEYWREEGPSFFAHVEHFLSACESRSIRPIVVLFEAPPKDPPTPENLHATDPETAFGVHSPSRPEILQPRNWKGYAKSPIHFARRWAQEYATDDRLLATEIMNEPGKVRPRRDFVLDALRTVRQTAPDATLTMGTKDVRFARFYDDPAAVGVADSHGDRPVLDAYQFHMNLPANEEAARRYARRQRELADEIAAEAAGSDETTGTKPLWCTEWQRTLEEPPSRFAPNLASLAPTIRDLHAEETIDGDFFWSLMLKPAYLKIPRKDGRFNGLFHPDGAVYSRLDAESIAERQLDLPGRRALPSSWATHSFPYPGEVGDAPVEQSNPSSSEAPAADDESANRASKSDSIEDQPNLGDSLYDRLRRALGIDAEDEENSEK